MALQIGTEQNETKWNGMLAFTLNSESVLERSEPYWLASVNKVYVLSKYSTRKVNSEIFVSGFWNLQTG